ncbi:MAG: hypothetical protein AAF206_00350 [Bacteroidota bacterium]
MKYSYFLFALIFLACGQLKPKSLPLQLDGSACTESVSLFGFSPLRTDSIVPAYAISQEYSVFIDLRNHLKPRLLLHDSVLAKDVFREFFLHRKIGREIATNLTIRGSDTLKTDRFYTRECLEPYSPLRIAIHPSDLRPHPEEMPFPPASLTGFRSTTLTSDSLDHPVYFLVSFRDSINYGWDDGDDLSDLIPPDVDTITFETSLSQQEFEQELQRLWQAHLGTMIGTSEVRKSVLTQYALARTNVYFVGEGRLGVSVPRNILLGRRNLIMHYWDEATLEWKEFLAFPAINIRYRLTAHLNEICLLILENAKKA